MVEMLTVVAIAGALAATALMVMPGVLTQGRADGGTQQLMNTLRLARDNAIDQRRNVEVHFIGNNHIQVIREDIGNDGHGNLVISGSTTLNDVYLENEQFTQFTGQGDTPDAFGASGPIAFGTATTYMFTSEGTFIDSQGDVLNGTVFLGVPGQSLTSRALTIFGPTALLHVWKWDGSHWTDK